MIIMETTKGLTAEEIAIAVDSGEIKSNTYGSITEYIKAMELDK